MNQWGQTHCCPTSTPSITSPEQSLAIVAAAQI